MGKIRKCFFTASIVMFLLIIITGSSVGATFAKFASKINTNTGSQGAGFLITSVNNSGDLELTSSQIIAPGESKDIGLTFTYFSQVKTEFIEVENGSNVEGVGALATPFAEILSGYNTWIAEKTASGQYLDIDTTAPTSLDDMFEINFVGATNLAEACATEVRTKGGLGGDGTVVNAMSKDATASVNCSLSALITWKSINDAWDTYIGNIIYLYMENNPNAPICGVKVKLSVIAQQKISNDPAVAYIDNQQVATLQTGVSVADALNNAGVTSVNDENSCGWFSDSELTQVVSDSTTVVKGMTLYTKTANTNNLTFTNVTSATTVSNSSSSPFLASASSLNILNASNVSNNTYSVKAKSTSISGEIVIPKAYNGGVVTTIENNAFANCSNITKIVMPNSITSVGSSVLSNSNAVQSISLPNSIQTLNSQAFASCNKLVEIINGSKFNITSSSYGLSSVYNSDINVLEGGAKSNVNNVGDYVFYLNNGQYYLVNYLGSATTLVLPDSCNGASYLIRQYTFMNSNLTSVTIPSTFTEIASKAFYNCSSLTTVNGGTNVASIGEEAFNGCTSLTTITFSSSLNSVGAKAFYGVKFGATSTNGKTITLPSSITSIGQNAFTPSTNVGYKINSSEAVLQLLVNSGSGLYVDQELLFSTGSGQYDHQYLDIQFLVGSTLCYQERVINLANTTQDYVATTDYYIALPSSTNYSFYFTHYIKITKINSNDCISRLVESLNVATTKSGSTTTIESINTKNTYYTTSSMSEYDFTTENTYSKAYSSRIASSSKLTFTLWLEYTFTTGEYIPCFIEGSQVTLADGSTKNIEDITYDDLLLVWNFDTGRYDASYPVWISKNRNSFMYYEITFDDGTVINTVVAHRFYSLDENYFVKCVDAARSQVGHNFFAINTDCSGNTIFNNAEIQFTSKEMVSIELVQKEVTYVNIITAYSMNMFVSSILTSTGMNNLYGTFTDNMTYDLNKMEERQQGGYGLDGTMYAYEELDVPMFMYVGLRLAEQKGARSVDDVNSYVELDLNVMKPVETDSNGNRMWIVSYSDEDIYSSSYSKTKVAEGEYITLKSPTDNNNFVGWYCSSNGKIYQAGESVQINAGTHFIAIYN